MGVYIEDGYQFVFVDILGIYKLLNFLGELLNKEVFSFFKDIDCVLFLSLVNEDIKLGDKFILERIMNVKNKIVVIFKIDLVKLFDEIVKKIDGLKEYGFNKIILVLNKNDKLVDLLIEILKEYVYDVLLFYDEDYIIDKFM